MHSGTIAHGQGGKYTYTFRGQRWEGEGGGYTHKQGDRRECGGRGVKHKGDSRTMIGTENSQFLSAELNTSKESYKGFGASHADPECTTPGICFKVTLLTVYLVEDAATLQASILICRACRKPSDT
jgi:hypothetical protein